MEYRYRYLSTTENPFYYIERKTKTNIKWKFCYKVDSIEQAKYLVKNPIEIERTLKIYRIGGITIIIFFLINILLLTIFN